MPPREIEKPRLLAAQLEYAHAFRPCDQFLTLKCQPRHLAWAILASERNEFISESRRHLGMKKYILANA